MKLAVDCRMIGSGGIGTYISELIPHFLKAHQCLLLGSHEQCMSFVRLANAEFCWCPTKPFSLKEMCQFPKDVLSAVNSCNAYYTPYCNIPGGITIPVFSTIHDVVFLDIKGLTSFAGRAIRRLLYKRAVSLSKAVFTVSEFSKGRIIKTLHCKKPVIVGYNGISSWLIKPDSEQCSKTDTILFVGNVKKHKGLGILLNAFSKALSEGLEAKLIIAGRTENFRTKDTSIASEIEKVPKGSVAFTGMVTNDALKLLYRQAKILVQPSLYEGFGIPPLEALACGTNVIISDIPVFHEIYGGLPVTFFHTGDSDDLCQKILQQYNSEPPVHADIKYSYENTACIILETIDSMAYKADSKAIL